MNKCPFCSEVIQEDVAQCKFCKSILDNEKFYSTKKCPYCAEEIKYEAIKCKYCGTDLSEEAKKSLEVHPLPALLSFFIPGLGQMTKGQIGRGINIFLGTAVCYAISGMLVIIVHIWNIYDAYNESLDKPQETIFTKNITVPKKYKKTVIVVLAVFILLVFFTIVRLLVY